VAASNELLQHGSSQAAGYAGNCDALFWSGHGEYILDYLRSPEGPDPTFGAGGLFVTPMESEHPASSVAHSASNCTA
jgi:hypothetical protein